MNLKKMWMEFSSLFHLSQSGDGTNDGKKEKTSKGLKSMNTFLQIIAALPSIIKTIIELVQAAEEAWGSIPNTGADKKANVMSILETIVDNSDLRTKVKNLFSAIINTVAFFKVGATGNDPAPKAPTN